MNNDKIINTEEPTGKGEAFPLLDSRLITRTKIKKYNIKVVECGDYIQVYHYPTTKYLSKKKDNTDLELKKIKVDKLFVNDKPTTILETEQKIDNTIETRNIIRSKLSCQRLAKSNHTIWETFITLTIADNVQDIKKANNMLHNFTRQVRRVKKDFSYIAIPEFQKRGAIHYHLLTNISIDDDKLIYNQADNSYFKHVKYWNEGFTDIEIIKGDIKKIIGYVSKYMTKDIDNRLFGYRRYLYSQNLSKPKESYIDDTDSKEFDFYKKRIQNKELIYQSNYINPFDESEVSFFEFIKTDNSIIQ